MKSLKGLKIVLDHLLLNISNALKKGVDKMLITFCFFPPISLYSCICFLTKKDDPHFNMGTTSALEEKCMRGPFFFFLLPLFL